MALLDFAAAPGQALARLTRGAVDNLTGRPDVAIENLPLLTTVEQDPQAPAARHTDDVGVLDVTYEWDEDRLKGIAYRLAWREFVENPHDRRSWEQVAFWRYVSFRELVYLPVDEREVNDMMGRTHILNRGLYNANVNLIYLASGVFTPRELGVLQIYGSAGEDWDRAAAVRRAGYGVRTIADSLHAAFPHARVDEVERERVYSVMEQITKRRELALCMGYPDPRAARKGMGHEQDGSISQSGASQEELASQQTEYLMRALSRRRANFLFAVSAQAVSHRRLAAGFMGTARLAADYAGRQRGNISSGMSVGVPFGGALNAGVTGGVSGNVGENASLGHNWSEGWNEGQNTGWSEGVSEGESYGVSEGFSEGRSAGDNISSGVNRGLNAGRNAGVNEGFSENRGASTGENWGANWGQNQSAGESENTGRNAGTNEGWSTGESWGRSAGGGSSTQDSTNSGWSEGFNAGSNESRNIGRNEGEGRNEGVNASTGVGTSTTMGGSADAGIVLVEGSVNMSGSGSYNEGAGTSDGWNVSAGVSEGESAGTSRGVSGGRSGGESQSSGESTSWNANTGGSAGRSGGASQGVSSGRSTSYNEGSSQGGSHGVNVGESWGESRSLGVSQGGSAGQSYGENKGVGRNVGENIGRNWGENMSRNTGYNQGRSGGASTGRSGGQGANVGRGISAGSGVNLGQSLGTAMNAGLAPAFNIGRGWNTEDDTAIQVTQALRQVQGVFNEATIQGAFLVSAVLMTDEEDIEAAMTAGQMAWHGASVPITMEIYHLTKHDQFNAERLRNLTHCFLPGVEGPSVRDDPTGSGLIRSNATVLPSANLAAYVCPSLFEHGRLRSTQQRPPATAYYDSMPGEVMLGHFISPEDGERTTNPVRLSRDRHFHTCVLGDTGFGKTVLMERLAYETTLKWHMQTIVFDFGRGWRKLVNGAGLEGRVDVRQLSAGGTRPLRWNPLQIGRRIDPEVHWRRFCEVFASTTGMGAARQMPEMRTCLYGCYIRAGVLTEDPLVREQGATSKQKIYGGPTVTTEEDAIRHRVAIGDPEPYVNDHWWQLVDETEVDIAATAWREKVAGDYQASPAEIDAMDRIAVGFPIGELPRHARQAVGRWRSRRVGPQELMDAARQRIEHPGISSDLQGYLQGISTRLETLVQGQAAEMFAAGDDVPDICEIVPGGWGICVLEGGAELDETSKAFLLGWAGWLIYQDCVKTREESGETSYAQLQLIFEEANKIFGGGAGGAEDGSMQSGPSTAEQWESMWRDSRKYEIFLHAVAQNPSKLPEGIVSSSNNLAATQLKNRRDQEVVMTHMHRSSKGYTDEEWSRYFGSIAIAETVLKLGYTDDRSLMEPIRMRPAMLHLPEPSDSELANLTLQTAT